MLKTYVAPYDATIVEKIRSADSPIVGTTNMDEFGMGSSTTNSIFGPTINPWSPSDIPHVCGGSSGGAAASVALGMADVGIGSDTGGSVRQPAALTGLIGFKPTYGRVSRYGLVAYASSLDTVGWITRSVDHAARVLALLAGPDERDSTTARLPTPKWDFSPRSFKIAVPHQYTTAASPAIQKALAEASSWLEQQGCTVTAVSLPSTQFALSAYYLIASAEAASNLSRYDGVRYGGVLPTEKPKSVEELYSYVRTACFGQEVQRRLRIGTFALASDTYDNYFLKAAKVRTLVRKEFSDLFADFDLVLTPTTPAPAWPLNASHTPLELYQQDVMTVPASLAGLPALSVPMGLSEQLPLGLQLIGAPYREEDVLAAGTLLESYPPARLVLDRVF